MIGQKRERKIMHVSEVLTDLLDEQAALDEVDKSSHR